jgi:hypothetical protein
MDARPQKHTRNSRWSRDPVSGPDGAPLVVYPTERDIEIFKLLLRFRFLASDYIHAFVGGSHKALVHRLNLLSRKPNLYLSRPSQQRQCADANYRPLIYELDAAALRALRDREIPCPPKASRHNFQHELMIAQITASIELGARGNPGIRLIDWEEILANENTPETTRSSSTPHSIPVSYSLRGVERSDHIIPDAQPFGLERTIDGQRSYLFCPGIEADCGTEPIDAGDPDRSAIVKKFAAYLAIAEQGIHRSHFGLPNFFVPFITTGAARMESMLKAVDRLTAGRGSKLLLFKAVPSFTSREGPPPPTGHMLTEPWCRARFPPLCFVR